MTQVLTFHLPNGFPGESNRGFPCLYESQPITPYGTTGAPTAYGVPVNVDQTAGNVGNIRTMFVADYAATGNNGMNPYGVLIRPFPFNSNTDGLGTNTPPVQGECDIMKSGYVSVTLTGGNACVKGGAVYIWLAAPSGNHILGGWESVNTPGSTMLVPSAYFMGPSDTYNMTEIAFCVS